MMSENQFDQRKAQFLGWQRTLGAQQQLVFRITAAIDVLMLLWVPRVVTVSSPLVGSESHSLGWSFIFSSPGGDGASLAEALGGISVHIDLIKLIFQFVLVNGIAVFLMKYLKEKNPTA